MSSPEQNEDAPAASDKPPIDVPLRGRAFRRASPAAVAELAGIGAATACAKLHLMGITRTYIDGPVPLHRDPDVQVVGSAVTLQFMPRREDVFSGSEQEEAERRSALWAVLETIQPGDVLVVAANTSRYTGCLGDMLVRYFKRQGGAAIVVDGCIRDAARVRALGVPVWCTGVTPHYASQTDQFPWAYDVPVAAGGALVLPGDIVVADEDGAVVVPQSRSHQVAAEALEHQDREGFARGRIDAGGRLSDYYPLSPRGRAEYLAARSASRDADLAYDGSQIVR